MKLDTYSPLHPDKCYFLKIFTVVFLEINQKQTSLIKLKLLFPADVTSTIQPMCPLAHEVAQSQPADVLPTREHLLLHPIRFQRLLFRHSNNQHFIPLLLEAHHTGTVLCNLLVLCTTFKLLSMSVELFLLKLLKTKSNTRMFQISQPHV